MERLRFHRDFTRGNWGNGTVGEVPKRVDQPLSYPREPATRRLWSGSREQGRNVHGPNARRRRAKEVLQVLGVVPVGAGRGGRGRRRRGRAAIVVRVWFWLARLTLVFGHE